MRRLVYYIVLIKRHAKHSGRRDALHFACRHWRFWQGADGDDRPYIHIGGNG